MNNVLLLLNDGQLCSSFFFFFFLLFRSRKNFRNRYQEDKCNFLLQSSFVPSIEIWNPLPDVSDRRAAIPGVHWCRIYR